MPRQISPAFVGVDRDRRLSPRLYARLLGATWPQLAEPLRVAHASESGLRGRLRISHGPGRLARALAVLLHLPRPNHAADTRLVIAACGERERWSRTFDDRRLDTWQYETDDGELGERFGVLEFRFRLEASGGSLVFRQREAAVVLGSVRLRLPAAWAPRIDAREDPAGVRQMGVHVRVVLPAVGPVLTYEGIIDVEEHHR